MRTNKLIPAGIILEDLGTHINATTISPIIKDLYYLRYNLKSWLSKGAEIAKDINKPLKNFIFEQDILILDKLCNIDLFASHLETIKSIKKVIDPNNIANLLALINLPEFHQYDRVEQTFLTRWMTLDDSKLQSLINNQIYASFPDSFNDIFDSQLRCDNESKKHLLEKYFQGAYLTRLPENIREDMSLEHKLSFINYYQDFFNSVNICCFSKLDPLLFDSHHMWGLYAECGKGIAIQYQVDDIIEFISQNLPKATDNLVGLLGVQQNIIVKPSIYEHCRILSVNYSNEHNKFEWFNTYLSQMVNKINSNGNTKIEEKFINEFHTNKSNEWQHEKEIRLISLNYVINNAYDPSHPINMTNYLNISNNLENLISSKNSYNKIIDFVRVSRIIFGWNFKSSKDNVDKYYASLTKYANVIEADAIELNKSIDYINKKFNYNNVKIFKR